MTARQSTGAPSSVQSAASWLVINWGKVEREVHRLQVRIAKAVKAGKYGKAKSLQWLLVRSHHAKLLSVKRVAENDGSRTAGVDGAIWKTAAEKYQAAMSLNTKGYSASPLRRIYISKRNGKRRPLSIPTMLDRAMQALYLLALTPIAEVTGDKNSYGFRPERSTQDACHQCYIVLAGKNKAQWVLEADIEGCFDNICHQWLLNNIPMDKRVLQQWLKAGFIEKQTRHKTERGTPQGGIASPVLANMALDGLETAIKASCPSGSKVNFVRYADDFIVTGANQTLLQEGVMPAISEFLKPRGLRLSPEKTKITHIEEGFDFLGFNIRKYKGKFLTKPPKDRCKAFLKGAKDIVKASYGWSGVDLIRQLNPKITGWANYYRGSAAKATYAKIDDAIFKMCKYWVLRKYGKRRRRKAVAKYFRRRSATRNWIFSDITVNKNDQKEVLFIKKMMDVRIQRHVKIRGEAHPFDPGYKEYFSKRKEWKKSVSDRQRRASRRIYAQMQASLPSG